MEKRSKPFNSDRLLTEITIRNDDRNVKLYACDYELSRYRDHELVNIICDTIYEFATGDYSNTVKPQELRRRLIEAAKSVYTTEKYSRRGELGELVLHFILRDWYNSIPLLSKIFYKSADNENVKGFDCVHVLDSSDKDVLFLGESKFYKNGKEGLADLAKDIGKHIEENFLKREMEIVHKKISLDNEIGSKWKSKLSPGVSLDSILSKVILPLLCVYESDSIKKYTKRDDEFIRSLQDEIDGFLKNFKYKSEIKVEFHIVFVPIEDKDKLIKLFNEQLKKMQGM